MDRLINHLQQTLDDDEVAKDALLMLKTVCPNTSTENPIDSEEKKNPQVSKSDDTISIEENSHIFILQMIASRILNDSVLPVDLPIKVIAMQLDISPKLIHTFCASQTMYPSWSSKFTGCFKQVLSILEWLIQTKMLLASAAQLSKLQFLREEIHRVQEAPLGAGKKILSFVTFDADPNYCLTFDANLQSRGSFWAPWLTSLARARLLSHCSCSHWATFRFWRLCRPSARVRSTSGSCWSIHLACCIARAHRSVRTKTME